MIAHCLADAFPAARNYRPRAAFCRPKIFSTAPGIIDRCGRSARSVDCEIPAEQDEPIAEAGSLKVSGGRFERDVRLSIGPVWVLRSILSAILGGIDGGSWLTAGELPRRPNDAA